MDSKKKALILIVSIFSVIILVSGVLIYQRVQQQKKRGSRTTAVVKEPVYSQKKLKVKKKRDPEVGRDNWMSTLKKQEDRKLKNELEKKKQDSLAVVKTHKKRIERDQFIKDSISKANERKLRLEERKRLEAERKAARKKQKDAKKRTSRKKTQKTSTAVPKKVVAKEESMFQIGVEDTGSESMDIATEQSKDRTAKANVPAPVQTSNMRICKIYFDQVIKHNGSVKLMSIDPIKLKNGVTLGPMTMLFGYARANNNRMKIHMTQAVSTQGNYDVDLVVYDSEDKQEGLSMGDFIEEGVNDAGDDVLDNTLSSTNLYGLENAVKTISKGVTKQKNRSLHLEDGDEVLVREKGN
eukprot:TRINITY_DN10156_c0_g1_i1.p1 TRINITY_DN10156_c0_g1~~TRINITY_DN10156_c0_g1_i1.p1  ORF type:complete len:353 (-),score=70.06 TRINITY_DN10156_c0_g1_i1:191-1249(-)